MRAVAVRSIDEALAVRRPREFRFLAGRVGHPYGVAAVLRGRRKYFAVDRERDLLSIWRKREFLELIAETAMLNRGGGRRAAQGNRYLACLSGGSVHRPHTKVPLERDRFTVFRD